MLAGQAESSGSTSALRPALGSVGHGKTQSSHTQLLDGFSADVFSVPDSFHGGDILDTMLTDDNDDDDVEDSGNMNAAPGRISEANLERIKEGLHEVQKLARNIATETGLSPSQVFNKWMSTSQRTHTKRNPWNLYSAYFKDNEQQERQRLKERESPKHLYSSSTNIFTISPRW